MKKTNRERDYPVIGELARLMTRPRDQLLYSRSARDLIRLVQKRPEEAAELARKRPVLAVVTEGRERLEAALEAERRQLLRAHEERLWRYQQAAADWAALGPELRSELAGLPLDEAHERLRQRATGVLLFRVGVNCNA